MLSLSLCLVRDAIAKISTYPEKEFFFYTFRDLDLKRNKFRNIYRLCSLIFENVSAQKFEPIHSEIRKFKTRLQMLMKVVVSHL